MRPVATSQLTTLSCADSYSGSWLTQLSNTKVKKGGLANPVSLCKLGSTHLKALKSGPVILLQLYLLPYSCDQ